MSVEQRVRDALREDGARLDVPARPALTELHRDPRAGRRWIVAAVATAAVVLVVLGAVWVTSSDLVVEIDPVAPGPAPRDDLSLTWEPDEVFAAGTFDGLAWRAAVVGTGPAGATGIDGCIGAEIIDRARLVSSSCGRLGLVRAGLPVRVTYVVTQDGEVASMAGYVGDEVARLVWELPDGDVEIELRRHRAIPYRVFAGAGRVDGQVTLLWAHDADGNSLGGTGVSGAAR